MRHRRRVHSVAGAIIGADGSICAGRWGYEKVPQLGNVVSTGEIGASTTIDRATLGSTVLGDGVKLDNLIQVAHNVSIGNHTVIAAQTGIAGSTTIGARCMIGGQVGINGHIRVADGTKVAAKSGITASIIQPNQVLQGNPARPIKQHQKTQVVPSFVENNTPEPCPIAGSAMGHAVRSDRQTPWPAALPSRASASIPERTPR